MSQVFDLIGLNDLQIQEISEKINFFVKKENVNLFYDRNNNNEEEYSKKEINALKNIAESTQKIVKKNIERQLVVRAQAVIRGFLTRRRLSKLCLYF